jgi:hypothetical protein
MPRFNFDKYGHVIRHTGGIDFKAWLQNKMRLVKRTTMAITIYRVGNTTIRHVRLRNGEVIETKIQEKAGEL